MPVDIPPSILGQLLQLGLPGVVIIFVTTGLYRLWKLLLEAQEARIRDRDVLQERHHAENVRVTEAIENLTRALREQHDASERRWKITETVVEIVKSMARIVEESKSETTRIGRNVDALSIRLETRLETDGKRFRD